MKLTYDPGHNIAYLRLHEKKGPVDTIRVSDEMNVDIAPVRYMKRAEEVLRWLTSLS
jgi:uncharacterized protein YuzE